MGRLQISRRSCVLGQRGSSHWSSSQLFGVAILVDGGRGKSVEKDRPEASYGGIPKSGTTNETQSDGTFRRCLQGVTEASSGATEADGRPREISSRTLPIFCAQTLLNLVISVLRSHETTKLSFDTSFWDVVAI